MSILNLPWHSFVLFLCVLSTNPKEGESAPSPPQESVETNEVTPQSLTLQTRKSRSTQLLFTGHSFHVFPQLCWPALDVFKDLHILLKWWVPELHAVSVVRPHQR